MSDLSSHYISMKLEWLFMEFTPPAYENNVIDVHI